MLLALGLAGCEELSSKPSAEEPKLAATPALTVGVTSAEPRDMSRSVVGTGSVVAWEELTIAAEATGLRVVEVLFDEGDTVAKGQLLVRLDDDVLQAQLRGAEAAIREIEALLAEAQSNLRRADALSTNRVIAEQTLEQRRTAVRTSEAKLAVAKAEREQLVTRIAETRIEAPASGIVSKRSVLIGAVVTGGTELLRLVRDARLEADVEVPELDIDLVRAGQPVRVRHGETVLDAAVRAVAPTVDPKTRLGLAHVALPPGTVLKPGMFVRAEIQVGEATALAVPQEAVVYRDGRPSVFAVAGENRVALRQLETGTRRNGWVEVKGGLEPGARVVVAGAGFLNDGDLVRVHQTASAAPVSGAR